MAKKHDGLFLLRIEDTDQKRFVGEAEKYIKDALEWVGIEPDYAPWKPGPGEYAKMRQSERDYTKETKYLLDNGHAYYAFDDEAGLNQARQAELTPDGKNSTFAYDAKHRMQMKNSLSLPKEEVDRLIESGAPYVIRFKTPENKTITFNDIIRGKVTFNTNQTDDKVLVKSNGIPTYHMANVCDDHNMEVTHVIRGEEWLPSTPLHILLYEAFGWKTPQFAHLPLILNPDGKGKLSKRKALQMGIPAFPMGGEGEDDKGQKVKYLGFKDEGFEPEAVLNFLLLLGWAPNDNQELFDMASMISTFSLDRVHKAGARYQIDKAKWFNQQHIGLKGHEDILGRVDFGDKPLTQDQIDKIVDIAKKRSQFSKDLQHTVDIFTKPLSISAEQKATISSEYKQVMTKFVDDSESIEWTEEPIKQKIFDLCQESGVKMNKVMPSLRVALVGGINGPDLPTTMTILGRDESVQRIKNAL